MNGRSPGLRGLECIQCSAFLPVGDYPRGCPECDAAKRNSNLYCRYDDSVRERLPYLNVPCLGQDATPLLELEHVYVKNEAANPTGSHKDRFAAMAVAHARAEGCSAVAIGSSGNAGLSLASFAAFTGLRCVVAVFSWLPLPLQEQLAALGAEVRTFDADEERIGFVRSLADDPDVLTVSNVTDPVVGSNCLGIEGYKRIAWEIAEQCPAEVRHVVIPSSRSDLAWGVYRGFADLGELRGTPMPRIHLVEPFPRLSAVLGGASLTDRFPGDFGRLYSIAGDSTTVQAHRTVTLSGGTVRVVPDELADTWFTRMCRRGHVWERSSTTVFAAYDELARDGEIQPGEATVLIATSHFFKGL